MQTTFVPYNPARHNEALRMEAALCSWDYLYDQLGEKGTDVDNLASVQGKEGIVATRTYIAWFAPSVLAVYDELLKINSHLPCYDYAVVPSILSTLDPFLRELTEDVVVNQKLAMKCAMIAAVDPRIVG